MNKILFLYSEIAQYFLTCLNELVKEGSIEIHLVRWPVNKEAPFSFEINSEINLYEKNNYSQEELISLVKEINPNLIFSAGWIDKDYIKICRMYKSKIPVVFGMDNQWTGSLKQTIATIISPITIQRYFSHAWVAGNPQKKYAEKLGFKNDNLLEGYYSGDVAYFSNFFPQKIEQKKMPKRFLYVGRYVSHKGILDLCKAFILAQEDNPSEWELWGLGTGELIDSLPKHPKIKHFGFIQPDEMGAYINETSVLVLPSHYEPWGVVVHEFATAGFPLICSREVGASTAFLEENKNGFLFDAKDINQLKRCLEKIIQMDDESLKKMSVKSHSLGNELTPEKWVKTLLAIL